MTNMAYMSVPRLHRRVDAMCPHAHHRFDDAINFWTKAAFNSENNFTTPIYLKRAAIALEEDGNIDRALEYYSTIQKDYSESDEARDIDKFITRAQLKQ